MKKIILLIFLLLTIQESYACDLCGCNSGNYFIGLFPQFNKHFIGAQYSFQRYNTILTSDKSQFRKDFYQTTELLLGTKIQNNLQLLLIAPYNVYYSLSDDGVKRNNGLGDLTFIVDYNLLDKKTLNKDTETVFQQLRIGAGIKLPTGKFTGDSSQLVSSVNMQPGTGSYDFLFNTIYSFQIRSWGFNFNVNYKLNQSAQSFKFGNSLSINTFVFRSFSIDKVTMSPNIGLLYESLNANIKGSEIVKDTGGDVLFSAIGFELRFRNIAFGTNFQFPISSNLSNGQTDAKIRGMCHLSYMF